MANAIGDLVVRLTGDDSGFAAAMKNAEQRLDQVASKGGAAIKKLDADLDKAKHSAGSFGIAVQGLSGSLGLAVAALGSLGIAVSATGLWKSTKEALAYADSLKDAAYAAGVSIESLQELRFAGEQMGVSTAQTDKALAALTQKIGAAAVGSKSAVAAFKQLGIEIRDQEGNIKPTEQVFKEIADRIKELPTAAEQAKAASDIFGKALGKALVQELSQGADAIEQLQVKAGQLGTVMSSEVAKKASDAHDAIERINKAIDQRWLGTLAHFAGTILSVAEAFERWNIAAQKSQTTRQARDPILSVSEEDADLARQRAELDRKIAFLEARSPASSPERAQKRAEALAQLRAERQQIADLEQAAAEQDRMEGYRPPVRAAVNDVGTGPGLPGKAERGARAKEAAEAAEGEERIEASLSRQRALRDSDEAAVARIVQSQKTKVELVDEEIARLDALYERGKFNDDEKLAAYANARYELERAREAAEGVATGLGRAKDPADQVGRTLEQSMGRAVDSLLRGMVQGQKGAQGIGDILLQVAGQFAQEIARAMAQDVRGMGGNGGGGLGGFLGDIGGGIADFLGLGGGGDYWNAGIGMFQFASGGVMTGRGPVPLRRYASGGIARGAQVAMIGEGSMPEAYVPLPDGRAIPVEMNGAGAAAAGPGQVVTINQAFDFSGANPATIAALRMEAERIKRETLAAVPAVVTSHADRGGSFAKSVGRRH